MLKPTPQLLISPVIAHTHHCMLSGRIDCERLTSMLQNPPRATPSIVGDNHRFVTVEAFPHGSSLRFLRSHASFDFARDAVNNALALCLNWLDNFRNNILIIGGLFKLENIDGVGYSGNLSQRLQFLGLCACLLEQLFANGMTVIFRPLKVILNGVTDQFHGSVVETSTMLD